MNEILCAENCVARWLWKNGQVIEQEVIKWDMESVNTCPENYQWQQLQGVIYVEAPGLYELTMAFFSKKRRPEIQIYANSEVIYQSKD